MRGFIDLVFEHQGAYYILDYKSNYLGPTVEHYDQSAMARSITEHQYDLQYLIYCLALHRYLGLRLPDYNYPQHFGGVYYLFLRGMGQGADAGRGVFYDKPPQVLVEALDSCFGGGTDL
jgi:exodeoxyribonuclease V beta subunit